MGAIEEGIRFVFVEGLPGSGKSTSARTLVERLESSRPVRLLPEGSLEPAAGLPWGYEVARETVRRTTLADYPFDGWTQLARQPETHIVDARLLQNTALFVMLRGGDELEAIPKRILEIAGPALVVRLAQSDAEAHLSASLAARKKSHPEWYRFIIPFFESQPWCQARHLRGERAYVEPLAAFEDLCAGLLHSLGAETFELKDAHRCWPESTQEMLQVVEARCA